MHRKTVKSMLWLSNYIKKHNKDHLIKIDLEKIVLDTADRSIGGWAFYFILMLLTPFGGLIYLLLLSNDLTEIAAVILWLTAGGYYAYYISRGDNIVTIDLVSGYLVIENIHPIFKMVFKKRVVDFSQITRTAISQESVGVRIKWLEMSYYDPNNVKTVLASFENTFPMSTIARMFKEVLDISLKEYRKRSTNSGHERHEKQGSMVQVGSDGDWNIYYFDPAGGKWVKSFPNSHHHGGGTPVWAKVDRFPNERNIQ
jgi:hypothetical protein